jgi:catabolite repression protein CreC
MHQQELNEDAEFVNHDVEPQARTAQLPPILSKKVDEHSLSGLAFEQDCIITSCQEGEILSSRYLCMNETDRWQAT